MRELSLYSFFALLLLLPACTSDRAPATAVTDLQESTAPEQEEGPFYHCFREEFPIAGDQDPAAMDVINLELELADDEVIGTYNWLPFYKDQRVGTLSGPPSDTDTLALFYTFQQEGTTNTVPVTLVLSDQSVVIDGGTPALGLGAEIPRIPCSDED